MPRIPAGCSAVLEIAPYGKAVGRVLIDGEVFQIDRFVLRGPGMHTVDLVDRGDAHNHLLTAIPTAGGLYSRTIGALSAEVFKRYQDTQYAIPGCGRNGSHVADVLARHGVRRITLIDEDRIEPHNIAEMALVSESDIGRLKVSAVAGELRRRHSTTITEVSHSISHLFSLLDVRDCDVIICTVDHDGARLAAQIIATIFGKILIDIGTGIHGSGDLREMGADVRLLIPGEACLLCLGGLRNEAEARRMLTSADEERGIHASRDWQAERTGSLLSLNLLAVSTALRAWEDFLAERIEHSTWVRLFFDPRGHLETLYPAIPSHFAPCPLCALAFAGNSGLSHVWEFLEGSRLGGTSRP